MILMRTVIAVVAIATGFLVAPGRAQQDDQQLEAELRALGSSNVDGPLDELTRDYLKLKAESEKAAASAPKPQTLFAPESATPLDKVPLSQVHVDRLNGFSVHYDPTWIIRQPNEAVTKLLVVAPDGTRCWVVVAPNPFVTDKDAGKIARWLVDNPHLLEAELRKINPTTKVLSVEPITMSGSRKAAFVKYALEYRAYDLRMLVGVFEAHIPAGGFIYKAACSTAHTDESGSLSEEFTAGSALFFRTFMLIPRSQ